MVKNPDNADAGSSSRSPNSEQESPRNNSSSLRKALTILNFIGDWDGGAGPTLSVMQDQLSMNKSTLLRLLAPLIDHGLVQRADHEAYQLGVRTVQLGERFLEQLDIRTISFPTLTEVVKKSGETAHLVMLDELEVVYVDKVESPNTIRMHSTIGKRQPLHCTAVGKSLVAFLGDGMAMTVAEAGMPARTSNTITTLEAFLSELTIVRAQGYAVDDVENEIGVRCVGAPIFDHRGKPVAAISVSGPDTRVTRDRVPELGNLVKAAAHEISLGLGAPART